MTQCPTSMFPLLGSDTFYSHCQYSAIYNEKQLCTNKNKGDHIPRYFSYSCEISAIKMVAKSLHSFNIMLRRNSFFETDIIFVSLMKTENDCVFHFNL